MKRLPFTREELSAILDYDPMTGEFRWKVSARPGMQPGEIAGTIKDNGYRLIRIDLNGWLAHRLAWFLHHGTDPDHQIDHANGDKSDNRIANLRKASQSENRHNMPAQRNNSCGCKGVMWCRTKQKWRARIMVNGKRIHLGRFETRDEAEAAYHAAAQLLVGEFAH